jgi:hypothetical protein
MIPGVRSKIRRTGVGNRVTGWTAVLALTVTGVAGCDGSATPGATAGAASAGVTPDATTNAPSAGAPSASPSSGEAAPVLAGGRHPVYLTGVDVAKSTVSFDLIEFLTGEAAQAEWQKQNPGATGGPDNDYVIINNNRRLRTLPVAAGASCVVLATVGSPETTTIGFAALPAFLKKQNEGLGVVKPHIAVLPFWLTVKDGAVTGFEEQFLP